MQIDKALNAGHISQPPAIVSHALQALRRIAVVAIDVLDIRTDDETGDKRAMQWRLKMVLGDLPGLTFVDQDFMGAEAESALSSRITAAVLADEDTARRVKLALAVSEPRNLSSRSGREAIVEVARALSAHVTKTGGAHVTMSVDQLLRESIRLKAVLSRVRVSTLIKNQREREQWNEICVASVVNATVAWANENAAHVAALRDAYAGTNPRLVDAINKQVTSRLLTQSECKHLTVHIDRVPEHLMQSAVEMSYDIVRPFDRVQLREAVPR